MEIVSEVPKEKAQALKRRSRRSARPQRAGGELFQADLSWISLLESTFSSVKPAIPSVFP